MESKKKRKGGAEREKMRKKKALDEDAAKYYKLTDMFSRSELSGETSAAAAATEGHPQSCSSCKNCPICCYTILRRYNLLTDAYHLIGLAYKYLLTLSVTQVACERTFSILKFMKNSLRTSLSQEHLEAFLLMSAEKEILMELDSDDIIDKVAETTKLMQRLLTY